MLNNRICWCGKLPSHADFIQSRNEDFIESIFMDWIASGQNHIGEQFFQSHEKQIIFFYSFCINSIDVDTKGKIYGVLFSSSDARGRACPFIVFTRDKEYYINDFRYDFEKVLVDLNFEIMQLNSDIKLKRFLKLLHLHIEHLKLNPQEYDNDDNMDKWFQLYPEYDLLNLQARKLNHIVYRKLLSR